MRKTVTLFLVLLTVFIFASCESGNSGFKTTDEYGNVLQGEEEDNVEEAATDIERLEADTSMEELEGVFLLRDDKYYSLNGTINNGYDIGVEFTNGNGKRNLYSNIMQRDDGSCVFMAYGGSGGIPEPVYTSSDKVVSFSSTNVPEIKLFKIEFYGYGVGLLQDKGPMIYDHVQGLTSIEGATDIEVANFETGEVVEDFYDLEYDECYTISWYEGTRKENSESYANNSIYRFSNPDFDFIFSGDKYDYLLEGSLTDYGYAEYDLSGVEPGLYKILTESWKGIIKVE